MTKPQPLGSVQRELLAHLAPVTGDVFDLRPARRAVEADVDPVSISRAVRLLVRRGVLEQLVSIGGAFIPADEQVRSRPPWERQVRFVRRCC